MAGVEEVTKSSPIRVKVSKFSYTEQERSTQRRQQAYLDETNSLLYNRFNNSTYQPLSINKGM